MDQRVRAWLNEKGVYNAIVFVDRKYFCVNANHITLSRVVELVGIPEYEAPEWLVELIRAGNWQ